MEQISNLRNISFKNVGKIAIIYMMLPLLCFFCGYLRWYYTLPCCIVLYIVVYKILSGINDGDEYQTAEFYSWNTVLLVFVVCLLWSYLGGMNGYYYQSWDWAYRNAVYFDLIEYDWPVIYPQTGSALVYYFGHWLTPAAIAKFIQLLSGSVEIGRIAGRILLWLWSSIGLTIIVLLLFHVTGAKDRKTRIAVLIFFIFFSGMDLIGAIGVGRLGELLDPARADAQQIHLERWCYGYEFSSMTTCVFWVFNQTIIPWMITLLFLIDDHPKNYVFYAVVCLLCGTLPCIGLAVLMLAKASVFVIQKIKTGKMISSILDVFSIENIMSFIFLFPVIASFILSCNTMSFLAIDNNRIIKEINPVVYVQAEEMTFDIEREINDFKPSVINKENASEWSFALNGLLSHDYLNFKLFVFLTLEVGCYMFFIWRDHWKNYLFYVIGLCFLIIPYIHVGASNDFCMRVSMPGIFILMVYTIRFLLKHVPGKDKNKMLNRKNDIFNRIAFFGIIVCFIIGTATPLVEIYRGLYHVVANGTILLEDQRVMTYKDRVPDNFACTYPAEHFFFKYLSR